jgi:hypothetical protein
LLVTTEEALLMRGAACAERLASGKLMPTDRMHMLAHKIYVLERLVAVLTLIILIHPSPIKPRVTHHSTAVEKLGFPVD